MSAARKPTPDDALPEAPIAEPVADEPFDVGARFITIQGRGGAKQYLPAQARLDWLRSEAPDSHVEQHVVEIRPEWALFKTTVTRIIDGEVRGRADGYGHEFSKDFPDFILKAATVSLARALNALGYGGSDLDEGVITGNVTDSPIDLNQRRGTQPQNGQTAPPRETPAEIRERANRAVHAAASGDPDKGIPPKFPEESDKHVAVHDLVCARFTLVDRATQQRRFLTTINEASAAELQLVRGAVEGWTPAQSTKALTWVRVISEANTESMLVDAGTTAKEDGVDDAFVRAVWEARFEFLTGRKPQRRQPAPQAQNADFAATDRAVNQAVTP